MLIRNFIERFGFNEWIEWINVIITSTLEFYMSTQNENNIPFQKPIGPSARSVQDASLAISQAKLPAICRQYKQEILPPN